MLLQLEHFVLYVCCYVIFAAAGCISLATDGICVIPNATVLKKDQKDKLQNGIDYYLRETLFTWSPFQL